MFSSYMEWFSLGLAALMGFVLAAITFFSLNIVLHLRVANWQIWALENVRNVHELKTRAKFQGYWIDDKFDLVGEKKKKCLIDLQKNFERPDVPETVEVDYQETLENVVTDASLSGERQAVLLMKEKELTWIGQDSVLWNDIENIIVMQSWQRKRPSMRVHLLLRNHERPVVWVFRRNEIISSDEALEKLLRD